LLIKCLLLVDGELFYNKNNLCIASVLLKIKPEIPEDIVYYIMTSFLGNYKKQKKNLVVYKTTMLESNVIEGQIYVGRQQFVNGIVLPLTTTDEEPRYFWRAKSLSYKGQVYAVGGLKKRETDFELDQLYSNKETILKVLETDDLSPVRKFDLKSGKWIPLYNAPYDVPTGMSSIHCHSLCRYQQRLIVLGGQCVFAGAPYFGLCFRNMFQYDLDSHEWKELPHIPGLKNIMHHSAIVHEDKMYVFGGIDVISSRTVMNNLYCFNFTSSVWSIIKTTKGGPLPRFGHIALKFKGGMLVHGGMTPVQHRSTECVPSSDMLWFNFKRSIWFKIPVPENFPKSFQFTKYNVDSYSKVCEFYSNSHAFEFYGNPVICGKRKINNTFVYEVFELIPGDIWDGIE
jgi:hypothetical protein